MDRDATTHQDRLLLHSEWVERLARRLISGRLEPEDLGQEARLRALEHPPREGLHLRAWLRRVMGNLALQARRSEAARVARESIVAAPEATPSTFQVVERAELHRMLVEEVLAVPEPYRSTLLLRFFDELEPPQIAVAQGLGVNTVYTRLRRGLSRLRARLIRRGIVPAALWILLRHEGRAAVAGAAAQSAATLGGGLVMTGKAKLCGAAILVVLAASALWKWPANAGEQEPEHRAERRAVVASEAAGDVSLPGPSRELHTPTSDDPADTLAEANRLVFLGQTTVEGRVVLEDGTPVEGAIVEFRLPDLDFYRPVDSHQPLEEWWAHGFRDLPFQPPAFHGTTDEKGRFAVPQLRSGIGYGIVVRAKGLGLQGFEVPIGAYEPLNIRGNILASRHTLRLPDLVLNTAAPITVRVLDEEGAPVPGARVYCNRLDSPKPRPLLFETSSPGVTDAAGRVTFCPRSPGRQWVVAVARDGREAILPEVLWPQETPVEVDLTLQSGFPLQVKVVSGEGAPLPGLHVTAFYRDPLTGVSRNPGRTADESGVATFQHLPAVSRELHCDTLGGMPGVLRSRASLQVDPVDTSVTMEVDLTVPVLPVRFVDAASREPVSVRHLSVVQGDFLEVPWAFGHRTMPTRGYAALGTEGRTAWIYVTEPRTRVRPDGSADLGHRQSEDFGLVADAPGYGLQRFGPFEPEIPPRGRILELEMRSGHQVQGRVLDPGGDPVAEARVKVIAVGSGQAHGQYTFQMPAVCRALRTDEEGRFRLSDLHPGDHLLVCESPGFLTTEVTVTMDDEDRTGLDLVLQEGALLTGVVRLDEAEDPGRFLVAAMAAEHTSFQGAGLDEEGRFELGPFAPGEVWVVALPLDLLGRGTSLAGESGYMFQREARRILREREPPCASVTARSPSTWVEIEPADRVEERTLSFSGVLRGDLTYLDVIQVFWEDPRHGLKRSEASAMREGFTCEVGEAPLYLMLAREVWKSDRSYGTWYVASQAVEADELRFAPVELVVARGSAEFRFTRPSGAPLETGCKLVISAAMHTPGFYDPASPWRMNNIRVCDVPNEGTLRVDRLPAQRCQYRLRSPHGETLCEGYVVVEEGGVVSVEGRLAD